MVDSSLNGGHRKLLAPATDLTTLWDQFVAEFPNDDSCIEEFYRRGGAELLICHHCSEPLVQRKLGARVIECSSCHQDTWPTAGTFLERMRRPRAWLAVLWFYERGVSVNSWKLHELSGIAPSSALNLLRKFATVIRELLLDDAATVPSELFCGLFSKRSRETPAREHPRAEQYEFRAAQGVEQNQGAGTSEAESSAFSESDSSPSSNSSGVIGVASTASEPGIENDDERKVYSLLSDEPMHFDLLCSETKLSAGALSATLTMLELAGLVERLIGDYFLRQAGKQSHADMQVTDNVSLSEHAAARVSEITGFISTNWGGISRKYLQNYIGVFCFLTDHVHCRPVSLLAACLRFGPVGYKQATGYVTPALVRIGAT